jgi:c-di-GMP-binding flagellar brake protein YcgR
LQVGHLGRILVGGTSDLSEGGVRCTVTGDGSSSPTAGDVVDVALFVDSHQHPLRVRASVVRAVSHGGQQSSLLLEFLAMADRDRDQIRARVFLEQRNQRAAALS